MFFSTTCPHCQHHNRTELSDNGIHLLTCLRCGQKYCVYLRKQKFEMLFDLATRALLDGYGREAVASFAAALERFFEFYVRVFVLEQAAVKNEDFQETLVRFDASWRHVASQSERQLGMFALAYLLREGKEPEFLVPKLMGTDFRNRVIHRGYLPRREEIDDYAAKVFALIDRLLNELGTATAQAEMWQAHQYDTHIKKLPSNTIAVFEEHAGMFRARRFAGVSLSKSKSLSKCDELKLKRHSATASHASNASSQHSSQHEGQRRRQQLNDHAVLFQQALEERAQWLKNW